ncbi:glycine cleavage system H protein [Nocardia sp. NPDC046763]|uniref:glycine cleavage system protein H n=1 Tax=Nocardia sp. NPDC046763 TaxID=3155256 RepID=UPI0033C5CCBE
MYSIPADLRYTDDDHEWVRTESDGCLTVGFTEPGLQTLGEIVFLELPRVGVRVEAGGAVGTLETVKVITDIATPVSGEVVAINSDAAGAPGDINRDPYGAWLFRIKPDAGASTDHLLDAAAYKRLVR